jgi:hypothetical protein
MTAGRMIDTITAKVKFWGIVCISNKLLESLLVTRLIYDPSSIREHSVGYAQVGGFNSMLVEHQRVDTYTFTHICYRKG